MGEDGNSFHELPVPKTLRFSTEDVKPLDILSTATAVAAPSQDISSIPVVEEVGDIGDTKCVPTSGGKYADFIKVSSICLFVSFFTFISVIFT